MIKEENAIILDFLPNGYPFDTRPMHMKTAIAQALGRNHFVLLELVPKKGVFLQPLDEVYVGEGKRDKIHHIVGKIKLEKLTETAKLQLEELISKMITENEKKFVDFFNKAEPINTRRHTLELLPGLGKKRMWEIIEERKNSLFMSFEDLKKRIRLMPDPKKLIMKRVMAELNEEDNYHLFVGL